MDQREGVFPRALSFAREKFGRKATSTIALAVFKACTEVCLLWDWRARQKKSWESWFARATPGPRCEDGWSQCATRCPHHPLCCPRSRGALQPAAVCCVCCWHRLCPALKLPLSSLRWHRAISVRICPWPRVSPTSCLAPSLTLSTMKGCLQLVFRGSSFPLSRGWLPLLSYTTAGVEWGCSATRNGGLTGIWCVISVMRSEQCACHQRRCESTWQPTF
jgi:hypothetical protein